MGGVREREKKRKTVEGGACLSRREHDSLKSETEEAEERNPRNIMLLVCNISLICQAKPHYLVIGVRRLVNHLSFYEYTELIYFFFSPCCSAVGLHLSASLNRQVARLSRNADVDDTVYCMYVCEDVRWYLCRSVYALACSKGSLPVFCSFIQIKKKFYTIILLYYGEKNPKRTEKWKKFYISEVLTRKYLEAFLHKLL